MAQQSESPAAVHLSFDHLRFVMLHALGPAVVERLGEGSETTATCGHRRNRPWPDDRARDAIAADLVDSALVCATDEGEVPNDLPPMCSWLGVAAILLAGL